MSRVNLFLDSSAMIAGILSAAGAARVLLLLAEVGQIDLTISEQVVAECERVIARKAPRAINDLRQAVLASKARIVRDPSPQEVAANMNLISHPADVPIVLSAKQAAADYLVTLNRKHFINDRGVAARSGLRIGSPGEALFWVRGQITAQALGPEV